MNGSTDPKTVLWKQKIISHCVRQKEPFSYSYSRKKCPVSKNRDINLHEFHLAWLRNAHLQPHQPVRTSGRTRTFWLLLLLFSSPQLAQCVWPRRSERALFLSTAAHVCTGICFNQKEVLSALFNGPCCCYISHSTWEILLGKGYLNHSLPPNVTSSMNHFRKMRILGFLVLLW